MTESTIRLSLYLACPFNLVAALIFARPGSWLGAQMGLPADVPALYSLLVAFLVGLFGVAYGWLARQPTIDRPLLALGAVGKMGAFTIALGLWLAGSVPFVMLAVAVGDLAFATLWLAWLRASAADDSEHPPRTCHPTAAPGNR